jgi:carbonic anhydrase
MPKTLMEGLRHFRNTDLARYKQLYRRLADEGQAPRVLFVTCSDSRVVPNLLTGSDPGDVFSVQTVGNIVAPPDSGFPDPTVAAVEFAVVALGVSEVVVCGHSACGAMKALYAGVPEGLSGLESWVELARPAALSGQDLAACADEAERDLRTIQRNVLIGLDRLAAHPLVAERRASKELILHGWYYDIGTGEVLVFDPESREFETPEELLEGD